MSKKILMDRLLFLFIENFVIEHFSSNLFLYHYLTRRHIWTKYSVIWLWKWKLFHNICADKYTGCVAIEIGSFAKNWIIKKHNKCLHPSDYLYVSS